MKIAIVHEMLVKLGGAERMLRTLVKLVPEAPVYTLVHNPKATDAWFGKTDVRPSSLQRAYRLTGRHRWLLPRMAAAIEALDLSDYDTVISSSSAFAHGVLARPDARHICYCHSPMRYTWDYTHRYMDGASPLFRALFAQLLFPIRQWDFRAASRPTILLANSEHVRRRIQKYWRRDAEVVYPPVDTARFRARKGHEDFFLIVSALTPFKRIDLAIHAFNRAKKRLVIVGDGPQEKYLRSIAGDTIEFWGRLSDEATRDALENCRAFIFPGEEDFGIAPVEAMAAGKPVLAYGAGGVTESVTPGMSGEFFMEPTPASLLDGLARLLFSEASYNPTKIRQAAERFDGSVFEKRMKEIIFS